MNIIVLAIVFGGLFGFTLNRVGATNPNYIINMLRLTNLHLAKVILLAIGGSSFILFSGLALGLIDPSHLSVKATYWGVIIGGGLLGIGFAIAGYCPGTSLCAAATGRFDALIFILGGLVGSFALTLSYPWLKDLGLFDNILGGKSTLANTDIDGYTALLPGFNSWGVASILSLIIIGIAFALPKSVCKD